MQIVGPARRADLIAATLIAAIVSFVCWTAWAQTQPHFPSLTGRVVDEASLLSPAEVSQVSAALEALEKKSSDQIVVVTLKSLQGYSIEDFGYQLGRTWRIGQRQVDNGVLLIIAPNEHKVRIEVGRGLEPQLTDALCSLIIQNAILPAFRRGDWAGGVQAGVRDITDVILGDPEAVRHRLAAGAKRTTRTDWNAAWNLILWVIVIALLLYFQYRQSRQIPQAAGQRRGGYGGPIVVPGSWGGSGQWGGSSGGGGGGFSGGGGDFGGGGSSGSW